MNAEIGTYRAADGRVFVLLGKGGFRYAKPVEITVDGVVVPLMTHLSTLTFAPSDKTVVAMWGKDGLPPVSFQHVDDAFITASTFAGPADFRLDKDGDLTLMIGGTRATVYPSVDTDVRINGTKVSSCFCKVSELHGDLIAYRYKHEWFFSEKDPNVEYRQYMGDIQHCWSPPKYGTDLDDPSKYENFPLL
jgi:hypothetical protein